MRTLNCVTHRAFTLVELLIVVGVITLLLALIMPSLSCARRAAAATACAANLRQWSAAVVMHAHSNDGFLPRRGQGMQLTTLIDRPEDWFNALPPLMGQPTYSELFDCRQIPRPGDRGVWMCPAAAASDSSNYFAYGMNMRLSTWQAVLPDILDRVAPTDRQVLMADAPGGYCSIVPSPQPYSATNRHNSSVNIAFLDGHAGGFKGEYVGCGTGDPLRWDVQWHVPNSTWPGPSP